MNINRNILPILTLFLLLVGCVKKDESHSGKLKVLCTTSMIADTAKIIGGDDIILNGLMGAGVDPHLYKASEGDVGKLVEADIIFYNGLHLEGKMVSVFERMDEKKVRTIPLGDALDKKRLIESEHFASNFDPHVWFSVQNWIIMTTRMKVVLSEKDPMNADQYEERTAKYIAELKTLQSWIVSQVSTLPPSKRILVTAHDAFEYFGKEYGFKVVGLQGLSTATEAGVRDVQKISAFIIENNLNAIFVESSIPLRTVQSLQASVRSKKHEVKIGGTLFSDALGDTDSLEGTYIGMYRHNVQTIISALK